MSTSYKSKKAKERPNPSRCPVCNGLTWLINSRYRCFDCEYEPPIEEKVLS